MPYTDNIGGPSPKYKLQFAKLFMRRKW